MISVQFIFVVGEKKNDGRWERQREKDEPSPFKKEKNKKAQSTSFPVT